MSFLYIKNRTGPSTEPWGTPAVTVLQVVVACLTSSWRTNYWYHLWYLHIQVYRAIPVAIHDQKPLKFHQKTIRTFFLLLHRCGSPFLKIGEAFALFQISGNILSRSDLLNKRVMGLVKEVSVIFSIVGLMPSGSLAFETFKDFKILQTSSSDTIRFSRRSFVRYSV